MFGAIIGDIVGSCYEFKSTKSKSFDFFKPKSQNKEVRFTYDTVLTIAVANCLMTGDVDTAAWKEASRRNSAFLNSFESGTTEYNRASQGLKDGRKAASMKLCREEASADEAKAMELEATRKTATEKKAKQRATAKAKSALGAKATDVEIKAEATRIYKEGREALSATGKQSVARDKFCATMAATSAQVHACYLSDDVAYNSRVQLAIAALILEVKQHDTE